MVSGKTSSATEELLWEWLRFGWKHRGIDKRSEEERDWFADRVKYEMSLFLEKQLADFLLFTSDAIRWCKGNGVAIGPGRGSSAASVCCYLLRITEIDPYKYPLLLFERFLDITRMDPPDIDVDCADDDRWRLWEYLEGKYGQDRVGKIANFVRYRGKNSLADVAKVYRVPKFAKEIVANLVIERSGGDSRFDATLEDTVNMFPNAKAIFDKYPDLWQSTRLEGNVRGMSVHAAGLIVANSPLTDICAVYEKDGVRCLSIDKYDCEYVDAVKLDFLGLSTMGMIATCLRLANIELETLYEVPDDDPETLDVFRRGDVTGVFQFEGRATRLINRDVVPDSFFEITDINALARPGPLFSGTTADYTEVKHGRKAPETYHPVVDRITALTKGCIIYQEQILQIVREVGGFSWTDANDIRRIIAKKIGQAAFEVRKETFQEGAARLHGMDEKTSDRIWKRLVTSGTYAFCCTGDTVLEKGGSRKGSSPYITVRELHDAYYSKTPLGDKLRYRPNGRSITLLGMSNDGRVRPSPFIRIEHPRPRRVIKVVTDTGRELRASREHQVLTPRGYRRLSQLRVGSRIIVGLPKEQGKSVWKYGHGPDRAHYNRSRQEVRDRSHDKCEHCGASGGLNIAHIMELEFYNGDYRKWNATANLVHLCDSCHMKFDYQKGHGKRSETKQWTKGRPTGTERIVSKVDDGVDLVYDISMEGPEHNYLSNGIVSHNVYAHSLAYSKLGWWCAYLKAHYPAEFYAACLTKTNPNDDYQQFRLMRDAENHGQVISAPMLNYSKRSWTIHPASGLIIAGWESIPGIGENTAERIVRSREEDGKFESWNALTRIPGIGPKTAAKAEEFATAHDPFRIRRADRLIAAALEAIDRGELPVPRPTYDGAALARLDGGSAPSKRGERKRKRIDVVWVGIVRERLYQNAVENERSRSGEEVEDILKHMKQPELQDYCTLRCFDATDEDVYVRTTRFSFPRFRRKIESIGVGTDLVVVKGKKSPGFGTSVYVDDIWVISPD